MDIAPPPGVVAWLDQDRRTVIRHIRRYGVHLTYVFDDPARCACCRALGDAAGSAGEPPPTEPATGPPFCYTTGLFGAGHPELLVIGLGEAQSMLLLNAVAHGVLDDDRDLTPGQEVIVDGTSVLVEELPNPGEVLFAANAFYQRPPEFSVPAYQLTWADRLGRFPWDEGHETGGWEQPRPGELRA